MAELVLDASLVAAWCLREEQHSAEADRVKDRVISGVAIVPKLFWYEMTNVLLKAERAGRIKQEDTEFHLNRISDLPLVTDSGQDEKVTIALARQHNLTAYDAAYLETAHRNNAELATFDRSLSKAIRSSINR